MRYNKPRIFILTFILFLLQIAAVHAQESRKLSIEEAVKLSIDNSKLLQLSKARIDEAVAATKEATQNKLPDVSVSANYMRLNSATVKSYNKDTGSSPSLGISQVL